MIYSWWLLLLWRLLLLLENRVLLWSVWQEVQQLRVKLSQAESWLCPMGSSCVRNYRASRVNEDVYIVRWRNMYPTYLYRTCKLNLIVNFQINNLKSTVMIIQRSPQVNITTVYSLVYLRPFPLFPKLFPSSIVIYTVKVFISFLSCQRTW